MRCPVCGREAPAVFAVPEGFRRCGECLSGQVCELKAEREMLRRELEYTLDDVRTLQREIPNLDYTILCVRASEMILRLFDVVTAWDGRPRDRGEEEEGKIKNCAAYFERFRAYHDGEPAWGSLHVVLEDENTEATSVAFCLEWAKKKGDPEGEALARLLLRMSEAQRLRVSREC